MIELDGLLNRGPGLEDDALYHFDHERETVTPIGGSGGAAALVQVNCAAQRVIAQDIPGHRYLIEASSCCQMLEVRMRCSREMPCGNGDVLRVTPYLPR